MPEAGRLSVGGIFATVSLETASFDRGLARVMKELRGFADDASRASGGSLKLDEGLASVGSSSTRAATGLDRAGKASATAGTAQQRAAAQAAQYARASMDVAAAMDRTAALGPKVQGATLRQLAAQDRLNSVQEGGVATTRQLASAQAGLIGANRGVAAATEAAAASAKVSSGAFDGMLKTAGELGLVLGGIEIAKNAIEFVSAGKELTAALNGVQAASHATDAEMKGVRAQAIGMGKDLTIPKATAVDAADAINDLVRSGMTLPRALASARSALLLAAAAQVKTADGARFLGDVLDDFGLQSDQAAHVANVLAGAATSAGGGLEDMFEAIKYSGPVARAAGVNVDSLVAAVAELAKGGIQGSMAGTGLRSMLLSLAGPTKQNAAGMKALSISAWDAQGNFKGLPSLFGQLHTAQERLTKQDFLKYVRMAFGRPASAVITAFAHQGIEGYDRFAKRVASGDVQKYADLMNRGLGASLAAVRKDFTAAGIDVYDKFGPNVSKVVALMAVNLPHAFHAAADVLHPFAVAGGEAASALGTVAHVAGELLGALGPLAPELKAAAQTALILWGAFKGYQVARAAVLGIADTVGALQARMVSGAISARNYGAGISATFAGNATAAERAALVQAAAAAQTAAANAREAAAVQQAAATEAVANAEKVADSGAASRAQIEFADANAAAAMASARSAQIAAIQTATAAETAAAGVATAGDEAALGWGAIAGPVGIAAAGIGIFATALFHSGSAAKQNTAEISSLTTAIQNDSGAIGENTRAQVAHTLQTIGALDAARKLGLNLKTVTDATLEGGPALQRLTALVQLYTVSSYGATKDSSARVAAARKLAAALGDEGGAVLSAAQAARNEAAASGNSTTTTDRNSAAKQKNAAAALTGAAALAQLTAAETSLAKTATASGSDFLASLDSFSKSAGTASDRAALISSILKANAGDALSYAATMNAAATATAQLNADISSAAKTAKVGTGSYLRSIVSLKTGTINYSKTAAAPLISNLQSIQSAALNAASGTYQHLLATQGAGRASQAAVTQYQGVENSLEGQLTKLGLTKTAAQKLTEQYLGVPGHVKTLIEQAGANPIVTVLDKIGRQLAYLTHHSWDVPVNVMVSTIVSNVGAGSGHGAGQRTAVAQAVGTRAAFGRSTIPPNTAFTVGEEGWEGGVTDAQGRASIFSHSASKAMGFAAPKRYADGTGNASKVASALQSAFGLTMNQLAGILGNLKVESGFNPRAHNVGENAWGIAQWEGGRLTALQRYADSKHLSFKSLDAQIGYLIKELRGSSVLRQIKKMSNAGSIAALVDAQFERSSGSTRSQRVQAAGTIAGQLKSGKISTTGGGNGLTQVSSSSAAFNAYNALGKLTAKGRVGTAQIDPSSVLSDLQRVEAALTKSGASGKFVAGLTRQNAHIVALAKSRNTAAARLAKASQAVKDAMGVRSDDYRSFKAAGVGAFDLTSAGQDSDGNVTSGALLAAQSQTVTRVRAWAAGMKKLIGSKVFPATYLRTLLGAGPSSLPTVNALLGMSAADVKQFAGNEKTIDTLSGQTAAAGAHKLDDPAVKTAQKNQNDLAAAEARWEKKLESAVNRVGKEVAAELSHLNVESKLHYKAGDLYVAVRTDENRSKHRKPTHK